MYGTLVLALFWSPPGTALPQVKSCAPRWTSGASLVTDIHVCKFL